MKSLKTLILANIDRQPLTDFVTLTTLIEPSTKSLVNMTESEKEEFHYTAVTSCRDRADRQTSVGDDVAAVNSSQLSAPLSKKFNGARSA